MSTSHLDRKALKRPDAFLEKINSVFHYINDNSRTFLAGLALLFVLGLGMAFFSNLSGKKAAEADSALFAARKTLEADTVKGKPTEWLQNAKPGLEQIEKVTKNFSGARAAFEAFLLLGDAYFDHGDAAKAAEYYKQAVSSARPRAAKPLAQYSLAYAYENTKNYDGAIDAMRQVISSGDKALKGDAMLSVARNYALKGDKPKALDMYGQVAKEFPASPQSKEAEIQSAHLK